MILISLYFSTVSACDILGLLAILSFWETILVSFQFVAYFKMMRRRSIRCLNSLHSAKYCRMKFLPVQYWNTISDILLLVSTRPFCG